MSSFIDIQYYNEHAGVKRVEAAVDAMQQLSTGWTATRGLAALLLAAVFAAAVAMAYQLMDTAEEGHLLALWIALWAAVFAALALSAGKVRRVAAAGKTQLNDWVYRQAMARADARLWQIASTDTRVMADLQNAINRQEAAPLSAADIDASLRSEIPRTLAARGQRAYGFYI